MLEDSESQPQLNINILLVMPLDLIKAGRNGFPVGVPAQGVFEPEVDMWPLCKPVVEAGP